MGDDDDRDYLNSLPELEREQILNKRHQERLAIQKKKQILDNMSRSKNEKEHAAQLSVVLILAYLRKTGIEMSPMKNTISRIKAKKEGGKIPMLIMYLMMAPEGRN